MFANWLLISVSVGYIGLLFLLAHFGGKYFQRLTSIQHSVIYALSLGVYCTSWGFLGTAAQAAQGSFTYFSVYLAPILLFTFCWPFIQRIIKVCLALNITSIADLLSARYGKSQRLAIVITFVALVGTLPYLALQLKAIVFSYQILRLDQDFPAWVIGLIVSAILAGFTILFGVRTIDISEKHPGVMIAIAFESFIKLIAFICVGLFASYFVFESPIEIYNLSLDNINLEEQFKAESLIDMFGLLIIVASAFLCLPRQFQVLFVEIKELKHGMFSRWTISGYILIFAILAAPIGLAGHLQFGHSLPTDAYALFLPAANGQLWLSLFSFIGAVSAASSMVIVSTIALSTMLSNEIVFPFMFKYSKKQQLDFTEFQTQLLRIRKFLVLFVIILSLILLLLSPPDTLSSLGEVAFGAIAQIGPALIAAFFWRRSTLSGVLAGVIVGFSIWFTFNFLPQFGAYNHLFIDSQLTPTTVVTILGLMANILVMYVVSVSTRQSLREQIQSKHFYQQKESTQWLLPRQAKVDRHELEFLVGRFIGNDKAALSFEIFSNTNQSLSTKDYDEALIAHAETTLAAVLGSASAKLVTSFAMNSQGLPFDRVAQLVEENSHQQLEFSRNVLQSAIENASEGISVIDGELNLVAWNQRYLDIFNYPEEYIYIGSPISQLIHYNLSQQPNFTGNINEQVQKRLNFIRQGSRHSSERRLDSGLSIHIEGNPIPGGGFVMIFSDITGFRQTEKYLKEENDDLEIRVLERTLELEQTNAQLEKANKELAQARYKAEQAHFKKSQYLKACSHDLLQPLSAARLFSSAITLSNRISEHERMQIQQIDNSLEIANNYLLDLNEIARIESGNISPNLQSISVRHLFSILEGEFKALAAKHNVEFKIVYSSRHILSDITLVTRIIQNFLSNAFRYCDKGKVLLGCRITKDTLDIQVWDTGPGIAKDQQQHIFEQFAQLATKSIGSKGLGLGLNIAKSLASLLNHQIKLKSTVDKGSMFSLSTPIAHSTHEDKKPIKSIASMQNIKVLCIDNDEAILRGMTDLLSAWKCDVYTAHSAEQALTLFKEHNNKFDFLLVDYHLSEFSVELDNSSANSQAIHYDGLALINRLKQLSNYPLPAILITATMDEDIKIRAQQAGVGYLRKIIKPIALRALMGSLLAKTLEENYIK